MTVPLYRDEQDRHLDKQRGMISFSRSGFARDFPYKKGEHVVFGGPTRRGKTTLAFQLLEVVCTPNFPAYVPISKPRDLVTDREGERLNFRRVSEWPPPPKLKEIINGEKPRGYIIDPGFGDLNTDMDKAAALTEKVLMERYSNGVKPKSKGGILVMDDTMVKSRIQGNDKSMVTILAMAGALDLGMWIFVQKPTDSGRTATWGYEMATHLFFTKGGDEAMKRRYREIIGTNGLMALKVIDTLEPYEYLYVHRYEGYMAIVRAN